MSEGALDARGIDGLKCPSLTPDGKTADGLDGGNAPADPTGSEEIKGIERQSLGALVAAKPTRPSEEGKGEPMGVPCSSLSPGLRSQPSPALISLREDGIKQKEFKGGTCLWVCLLCSCFWSLRSPCFCLGVLTAPCPLFGLGILAKSKSRWKSNR